MSNKMHDILVPCANFLAGAAMLEAASERKRQDDKWGEQNHGPAIWLAILTEEVGEVAKEIVEVALSKDPAKSRAALAQYRKELVEVAAVALAAVECYDRWTISISNGARDERPSE